MLEKLKNNSTITKREDEKESSTNNLKKQDLPRVNEDEEDDYYKYFDYENEDLNKLDNEELKKHKDRMESNYAKNAIMPGHKEFVYDKEVSGICLNKVEFKTDGLKSEWDEEEEF